MLIKIKRGWELPESAATPESLFHARRRLLRGLATAPALLAAGALLAGCDDGAPAASAKGPAKAAGKAKSLANGFRDPTADLYPVKRNPRYTVARTISQEALATEYNNFYEFASNKDVVERARKLPIRPWQVRLDGMVEKAQTIDIDALIRRMPLEERVYRFRCVEAWAMTVPWSGFPMKALVDLARPLSGARYVRMESFFLPEVSSSQRAGFGYPWPYVEGLTMAEATNEMTLMVTGIYGKPVPPQNGAPLRLITPWKYGFKSVKSLVKFTFTDKRPVSMWEQIQAREYGFWANVNPAVPHPRWSQAEERLLGPGLPALWERVPTRIWNGYGAYVADMYKGLKGEKLFM